VVCITVRMIRKPCPNVGYLPSFWIKLRMLSAPAVNTVLAQHYPVRTWQALTICFQRHSLCIRVRTDTI